MPNSHVSQITKVIHIFVWHVYLWKHSRQYCIREFDNLHDPKEKWSNLFDFKLWAGLRDNVFPLLTKIQRGWNYTLLWILWNEKCFEWSKFKDYNDQYLRTAVNARISNVLNIPESFSLFLTYCCPNELLFLLIQHKKKEITAAQLSANRSFLAFLSF